MDMHDYNSHEGLRNRKRPRQAWDRGLSSSWCERASDGRQISFFLSLTGGEPLESFPLCRNAFLGSAAKGLLSSWREHSLHVFF